MKPTSSSHLALYEALRVRSAANGALPQLEPSVRSFTERVVGNPSASNIDWVSLTICTDVFFRVGYPALVSPSASYNPRMNAA